MPLKSCRMLILRRTQKEQFRTLLIVMAIASACCQIAAAAYADISPNDLSEQREEGVCQGSDNHRKANCNEDPAFQQLIFIHGIDARQSDKKTNNWTQQANQDSLQLLLGIVNAVATAGIFIFTCVQAISVKAQLKIAADVFRLSHRPKVEVRQIKTDMPKTDGSFLVRFKIVNNGVAAAIVETVEVGVGINREMRWIGESPPMMNHFSDAANRRLEPGESEWIETQRSFEPDDRSRLDGGSAMLAIVGTIVYHDLSGIRRTTGFLRRLDQEANAFIPSKNPDEEYQD